MRCVAITGVSGYIGSLLLQRLDGHPQVQSVIGIDTRPPQHFFPKLRFFPHDIGLPLGDLFTKEGVESVVHLAFMLKPSRREKEGHRVNVGGTRNVIQACQESGVRHILYLGSTAAYGAHGDNPVPLTEEALLRPNPGFQYSRDKAEADRLFQDYASLESKVAVTILRGCVVLGPGGARSAGSKAIQPIMLRVAGHNPPIQYVHEEDLVSLLVMALERRLRGTFNIAGEGLLRYTEVARLAKRPMVALPRRLLGLLLDLTWALHLQSESHSAGLDFIACPWVASNEKLKAETGFSYRYSSGEALRAFLKAGKGKQGADREVEDHGASI